MEQGGVGGGGMRETKGETTRSEETESEAEGLRSERRWRRCGGSTTTLNPAWQGELRRDGGVRYEGGEETRVTTTTAAQNAQLTYGGTGRESTQ